MELESNLLLSQAKQLYHITPLREITTGYSGDSIFEAESGLRRRILRVAEFSNKKEAHVEFETRWHRISGAKNGGHCQTGTECKQPAL